MQMTYRKAIIILDRLVTAERIEVDREELREAVKVAQKALNIVAYLPPNRGRLIDADALYMQFKNEYCNKNCDTNVRGKICDHCGVPKALKLIHNAPTIIKAEANE